jgi:hypothetical protein
MYSEYIPVVRRRSFKNSLVRQSLDEENGYRFQYELLLKWLM